MDDGWEEEVSMKFLKNLKGERQPVTREGEYKEVRGNWYQQCGGRRKQPMRS